MLRFALILLCWLALVAPAWAGWNEGKLAYDNRDYGTARREFRSLAEQGDARGQHYLGIIFDGGLWIPQDSAEAARWYRKAAEQGYAAAQLSLGLLYHVGRGVPQDFVHAYIWFDLAAAKGSLMASMFRDIAAGKMTPTDVLKAQRLAREWLAKHGKAD